MSSIAILVMQFENCYVDYVFEGVVFGEDDSFTELYNIIATQLYVDVIVKVLRIEYKVDQTSIRMVIHSEMGVLVYAMLKSL